MMKNERVAAMIAALLCVAAVARAYSHRIGFGAGQSREAKEFLSEARASAAPQEPRLSLAGYVAGNDPQAGKPSVPVEWVRINGGTFLMGTDDGAGFFKDAKPVHEVSVKTFEMSKTEVTVGQANQYAKFKGARLPSESEWEYAGTSGGRNQKYPWGNEDASCERAVMNGDAGYGCGSGGTMPVCSIPAGNTAQGLCDIAGNAREWVEDWYHDSYSGAPTDGSAWGNPAGYSRIVRGGFESDYHVWALRADFRSADLPSGRSPGQGFRLARDRRD